MSAENKALVGRFIEVWQQRVPVELCASDFTAHYPGAPPMDFQAFEQRSAAGYAAFSNLRVSIEDLVAEGDRVAYRLKVDSTHTGDGMGVPATGKQISFGIIGIVRVAGGKVAEFWYNPDAMGLMQQIGALPSPGQGASA